MVYLYILPQINNYVKFFTHHIFTFHNIPQNIVKTTDSLIIVEDKLKIEHTKYINRFVHLKPQSHEKLLILGPLDFATHEVQNSLLKILEDAPKYMNIFIFTNNRHKILDTVKSRCQIIDITIQQNGKKLESYSNKAYDINLHNEITNTVLNRNSILDRISIIQAQKYDISWSDIQYLMEKTYYAINSSNLPIKLKVAALTDLKVLQHSMSLHLGIKSIYEQIILLANNYGLTLDN